MVSAQLDGDGWLCIAPGTVQRMQLSGTMYGGYTDDSNSVLSFRLLERRQLFAINYKHRGFFDLAGAWRGPDLVLNRPDEQGTPFQSGLFIDSAVVTLRWASYSAFETMCKGVRQ